MINITLPDGQVKQFEAGISGMEIAQSISISLAKSALAIEINGQQQDLSITINDDAKIAIITPSSAEGLEIIRHDAAHILAEAVKELYPDVQVTIGPAIENGFYYDFAKDTPFSADELETIEAKMREISKRNEEIVREEWDRDEAVKFFRDMGEEYKAEIIASIPAGEPITLYRQGEFIDLCRGPHAPSTGHVKHFKLMKVAGAYWRGDSNNAMLQRIYGTAWSSKKELADYLHMLEEAEKRDHRKIGKELDLFHLQEEAQGSPFWHPAGWSIYTTIEQYIRRKLTEGGYSEVKTPMLVDRKLWEESGHWDKFRENMFTSDVDDKTLALKPMNCPCHIQIFKQGIKSYRDLPLRMAEFGACHRYEPSGALHGLMRVRSFVQDDAHIFCSEDQITSETVRFCELLTEVYNDFGFTDIAIKFSDRPEVRAGSDDIWDKAETALQDAAKEAGYECELNPGEGAFYGPKLEFVLRDAIGREWQCGTLQVDFVMPERLDASYIAPGGERARPVMLHRAIIGSFERFIGILIEQHAGKFPLWLAPSQVAITTITNEVDGYAQELHDQLIKAGIRSELDFSAEKINYKIRALSSRKIPIIAVVGKKEAEEKKIALRFFGSNEQKIVTVDELITLIKAENVKYLGE